MTGATDEREGLQRLLVRAEKDEVIICTKMDRQERNNADIIRVVDGCYSHPFPEERPQYRGDVVIQTLAAIAEAERERILERANDSSAGA